MLHCGFKIFKQWLFQEPNQEVNQMTPELSPEYFSALQKEFEYVSTCLNYASQNFRRLAAEGMNQMALQNAINELAAKKMMIEIQLFAVSDYLNS